MQESKPDEGSGGMMQGMRGMMGMMMKMIDECNEMMKATQQQRGRGRQLEELNPIWTVDPEPLLLRWIYEHDDGRLEHDEHDDFYVSFRIAPDPALCIDCCCRRETALGFEDAGP